MNIDIFKRLLLFVILVLAQVLVLNHIHLMGCAIPLLYVYFILGINRLCPQWATLLWGFALGLSIDTFSNTPGLAASSLTLVALLQPYISYISICVFIFCLMFFSLEAFNFFNWTQWISNIIGSTLITVVFIIVIENVRRN